MMNVETVTRTIQLVLAPVVMVSACAILLGGLLQRYAALNERLRSMNRERFDFMFANDATAVNYQRKQERLAEIGYQIPLLFRRHRLTHHSVLAVYSAVCVFISDMFVIALAAVVNADWCSTLVLLLFLAGVLLLFIGVLYTAVEIWSSNHAVEYEVNRIVELSKSLKEE